MVFLLAWSFLIGLVVGSFLNVLILRGFQGEKPYGRSRCPECKTILSIRELIPLASFAIQKGRCRHCGTVLSWQYPLVEFGTGLIFAGAAWYVQWSYVLTLTDYLSPYHEIIMILLLWIGLSAGVVILVSDLRWQIIPDRAVLILFFLGVTSVALRKIQGNSFNQLLKDIGVALVIAFFFVLLWLVSRGRWMGLGDAKLTLTTSLLLGFPAAVLAFLLSFWLGGLTGIFLLLTRQKKLQSQIPFGPFILAGTLLAYLFTPFLLQFIPLLPDSPG